MRYLWEDDESFNQRLIDVHINRIRDALGKDSPIIKTVCFIGYSLNKDNSRIRYLIITIKNFFVFIY